METLLKFINENPWLNVVFILLTLVSIILTIIFYTKSRKFKKPFYTIRNFNLIREKVQKIDSVTILYQNKKIENLSVAKIAIWNAGRDTINKSDIADNDKLRLEIKDNHAILDAKILFEKNPANGFRLVKTNSPNIIEIDFDYFDNNEGIVIHFYHTANDNSQIEIKGSIKATKSIKRLDTSVSFLPSILNFPFISLGIPRKQMRLFIGWSSLVLPIIFVILSLVIIRDPKPMNVFDPPVIITLGIITGIYWYLGLKILLRRIPKGFDIFHDNF
jgi:hypothetical protein